MGCMFCSGTRLSLVGAAKTTCFVSVHRASCCVATRRLCSWTSAELKLTHEGSGAADEAENTTFRWERPTFAAIRKMEGREGWGRWQGEELVRVQSSLRPTSDLRWPPFGFPAGPDFLLSVKHQIRTLFWLKTITCLTATLGIKWNLKLQFQKPFTDSYSVFKVYNSWLWGKIECKAGISCGQILQHWTVTFVA